jgi:hypothetical protein
VRAQLSLNINARANHVVGQSLKLMSLALDTWFHHLLPKTLDRESPKIPKAAKEKQRPPSRGFQSFS